MADTPVSFTKAMTQAFKDSTPAGKSFTQDYQSLNLEDKLQYWLAFRDAGQNVTVPDKPRDMPQTQYDALLKKYNIPVS